MKKTLPFYDPGKNYEENYDKGPFGEFANGKIYTRKSKPIHNFLGQKIYLPFGIPAGPLLNSAFVKAAFEKNFDICVYKTVRSDSFPCHPFPNVLFVDAPQNLYPEEALRLRASAKTNKPTNQISITNSFGVPSRKPEVWQEDVKKAIKSTGLGQVMILSFMGTVREGQTPKEFVKDYAKAARLAYETGAKILEVNLSCPNIGNEGLVCYNIETTREVTREIRREIKDTPLILKIGHYQNKSKLDEIAKIAQKYAEGISAINTLQTEVVDRSGNQALPGKNRLKSGVCGTSIKWAGLETTQFLHNLRRRNKYSYQIIGVGGVMTPEDYFDYKDAGADAVMSATGAMWNPLLALEIEKKVNKI